MQAAFQGLFERAPVVAVEPLPAEGPGVPAGGGEAGEIRLGQRGEGGGGAVGKDGEGAEGVEEAVHEAVLPALALHETERVCVCARERACVRACVRASRARWGGRTEGT